MSVYTKGVTPSHNSKLSFYKLFLCWSNTVFSYFLRSFWMLFRKRSFISCHIFWFKKVPDKGHLIVGVQYWISRHLFWNNSFRACNKGCVSLAWSGLELIIRHHSDHGASKEPINSLWVNWFHWCTMIRVILIIPRKRTVICTRDNHSMKSVLKSFCWVSFSVTIVSGVWL